jgi:ABC-type amino acid transport substrate-binding protein
MQKSSKTWGRAKPGPQQPTQRKCGGVFSPPRIHTYRHTSPALLSLLAVVLTLVLAGTAACGRRTGTLDRVHSSGMLRIAVDPSFPPFEFVDGAGQIVGYDADLASVLAESLGVDAHFVTTGYDALYDALTVGRADAIISALYPDPGRTAGFAFSRPYFNAGEVILVGEGTPISAPEDLAGRPVACVFGTAGHMELLQLERTLVPAPTVIAVDDPVTITTLLQTQTVDAIVIDHVSAQLALGSSPSATILTPPLTDEPYVIAVRREDTKLLEALEKALTNLESDGTLEELANTWMIPH